MRTFLPAILLVLTACFGDDVINPSGDCEAEHDGSFVCYSVPGADDTYLPDCEAPLERELWRVFQQADGTAYMIPRPDAMGLETGICDGEDADLAGLFEANGLCEAILDQAGVELINSMDPAEALEIGHALHERLVFEAVSYGDDSAGVAPFAPPEDWVDACDGADDSSGICDKIDGWYDLDAGECLEMGVALNEEEAASLASLLNDLYGVAGR